MHFIFFLLFLELLRILMYEKIPTESKLRKYMIKQLQKIRKNNIFIPYKMDNKKNENKIIKNNKGNKRKSNTHKNNKRKFTIDTIEYITERKMNLIIIQINIFLIMELLITKMVKSFLKRIIYMRKTL